MLQSYKSINISILYLVRVGGACAYLATPELEQLLSEFRCEVERLQECVQVAGGALVSEAAQLRFISRRVRPLN